MLKQFEELCKKIRATSSNSVIIALQRGILTTIAHISYNLTNEEIEKIYDDVFGYSVKLQ